MKRKFEEYRKDYEKRKEHIREEASRKSKALAEDNKHFQRYSQSHCYYERFERVVNHEILLNNNEIYIEKSLNEIIILMFQK